MSKAGVKKEVQPSPSATSKGAKQTSNSGTPLIKEKTKYQTIDPPKAGSQSISNLIGNASHMGTESTVGINPKKESKSQVSPLNLKASNPATAKPPPEIVINQEKDITGPDPPAGENSSQRSKSPAMTIINTDRLKEKEEVIPATRLTFMGIFISLLLLVLIFLI